MLDLARLQKLSLAKRPLGQILFAQLVLQIDYRLPRRTHIVLEGVENIPSDRSVFFAMNHTDRYNCWPFQYQMYRQNLPFTATWVKGKYYENSVMGFFMDHTNNIPIPSRGYVITTTFRKQTGRTPSRDEYRFIRDLVDGNCELNTEFPESPAPDFVQFLAQRSAQVDLIKETFAAMSQVVVDHSLWAMEDLGLNILIFPQGTRSIRMLPGHTGLAQMAHRLNADIVPVGCNGSDQLYPGNSPLSKGGTVTYRIGSPISPRDSATNQVPPSALPFSDEAAEQYGEIYQRTTRRVDDAINALLDPAYQMAEDDAQAGGDASRFV